MIKSKPINYSETFYIRHSIIIDLEVLKILHQKMLQAGYNEIEYLFFLYMTDYNCNNIEELNVILEDNKISEINCLKVTYRNEKFESVTVEFKKEDLFFNSSCVYIHSSESRDKKSNLLEELIFILNSQNRYRYKRFASIIMNPKVQMVAYSILFVLAFKSLNALNFMSDNEKHYFRIIIYPFIGLLIFILKFSSLQKVRITKTRLADNSFWIDIGQPFAISIGAGFILLVLNHYWLKF